LRAEREAVQRHHPRRGRDSRLELARRLERRNLRADEPEYDDERSGTFEPLRHVPDDRTVVLGLVSTKIAALESPRELEARIAAAARVVPLDRLALSPQCGFASTSEGNRLSIEDQRLKLNLVGETARAVWPAGVSA